MQVELCFILEKFCSIHFKTLPDICSDTYGYTKVTIIILVLILSSPKQFVGYEFIVCNIFLINNLYMTPCTKYEERVSSKIFLENYKKEPEKKII